MLETCNTLWIGEALGAVERACLKSVLRQGHAVRLYCYRPPGGVPEGVEIADAPEILGEDQITRHRAGSVALFSDRFRYELQRLGKGVWIDADLYLLRPLPATPYLFGFQDQRWINGAVLRLPQDCPMLPGLLGLFEERTVPDWLAPGAKLAAWWRLFTTGRSPLGQMPWGVAGPHALTALARRYGLLGQALPPEAFYPVAYDDAAWITNPAVRLEDVVTDRTIAVHLWNELIRPFKDAPARPGSFLERLQQEGRLDA
jgi:hypothetical protein